MVAFWSFKYIIFEENWILLVYKLTWYRSYIYWPYQICVLNLSTLSLVFTPTSLHLLQYPTNILQLVLILIFISYSYILSIHLALDLLLVLRPSVSSTTQLLPSFTRFSCICVLAILSLALLCVLLHFLNPVLSLFHYWSVFYRSCVLHHYTSLQHCSYYFYYLN